ncbi:MAG: nitrite reductase small subunit NirD [Gammaproteobacteria bacterium]
MDAAKELDGNEQVNNITWQPVCPFEELVEHVGVCALLGRNQVAVFKFNGGEIYAIDNYDPFSDANVLSRGISGDIKGQPVVASPIYKQHFNLETGQCLEDESVTLPTYKIQVIDGIVHIAE